MEMRIVNKQWLIEWGHEYRFNKETIEAEAFAKWDEEIITCTSNQIRKISIRFIHIIIL